jgi:RimJ/RimL family protein N-acetyltransferase
MDCLEMSDGPHELATRRLRMRQWRDSDREPFAALNADPEVMRHFPGTLPALASDAMAADLRARIAEQGWGLWAVEVAGGEPFIGFVGLSRARFDAHFAPAVEVGWRLVRPSWGHGYATEAARAALAFGFERLELDQIVSFTTAGNARSRRVMERLRMSREPTDDFDHPAVAPGPLRRHVLYRLRRTVWGSGLPEPP